MARPIQCLLSRRFAAAVRPAVAAAAAPPPPTASCRAAPFHSSAPLDARRRKRFASLRAEEMGLVTPEKVQEFTDETFQPYTKEEIEVLKKHYSADQMEALEAGEAAIDPKDLTIQGRLRRDAYQHPYLDDFSRIAPVIDKRPKSNIPPPNLAHLRWMTEDEFVADLAKFANEADPSEAKAWLESKLADPALAEGHKRWVEQELIRVTNRMNRSIEAGAESADSAELLMERGMLNDNDAPSNSVVAPGIGKGVPGVAGIYQNPIDPEDVGLDDEGIYQDLKRRTGMTVKEILSLKVKVLVVRMVANQTRLGKIQTFWVMAIAGNGNGRLGIGEAKSVENGAATLKAKLLAIRNMKPIRRYEERTIYGNSQAKFGATVVHLEARPPGKPPPPRVAEAMPLGSHADPLLSRRIRPPRLGSSL